MERRLKYVQCVEKNIGYNKVSSVALNVVKDLIDRNIFFEKRHIITEKSQL